MPINDNDSNNHKNDSTAVMGSEPDPATAAAIAAALQEEEEASAPTTRSTRSSSNKRSASSDHHQSSSSSLLEPDTKRSKSSNNANSSSDVHGGEEGKRPKAQELLEDYVEFAANLMLPSPSLYAPTYHRIPTLSALQFLQSPQRRRTVWEDWSPYQIALFEAGMAHYGKDFYAISKEFRGKKSTQQIIDFYYLWKKTAHYKFWKKTYLPAHLDVSDDEDDDDDESGKEGGSRNGKLGK